ncbi:hypothetical protein QN405_26920, partial [Pseudomonas sp. AH2 (2023)]|nr:hypothetical protein [Pseudomonas sp. AH2 (2023)]
MWGKVERLRQLPNLRLSDFGTRRRHGHLWQRWCVEALKEGLGEAFSGTSNVLLAMDAPLLAYLVAFALVSIGYALISR